MPKWASENSGVHWVSVRNSHTGTVAKNDSDSLTRMNTIPTVVATATSAAASRMNSITRSPAWRRAL